MGDAWRRMSQVIQQQQRRGGFGAGGGGGGGPPARVGAGLIGLVLLGGGAMLFQNALFNVDGGHRAIKYRRISGVSKQIYAEGRSSLSDLTGELGRHVFLAVDTYLTLPHEQAHTSTSPGSRRPSSMTCAPSRASCRP